MTTSPMSGSTASLLRFVALCLLCLLAACSEAPIDFAGRFTGAELTVELQPAADGYAGSITRGGARFRASAQRRGEQLAGEFTDGANAFPFTVAASPDGVRLMTGGTTYELRRQVADNPLARPEAANPLAVGKRGDTASEPGAPQPGSRELAPEAARELETRADAAEQKLAAAPAFTETYRHPTGVYLLHPAGWTVQPLSEGAVALNPPDPLMVGGERAELTIVVGEHAGGATRVDAPGVVQLVERFVADTFPYLRRQGSPKTTRLGTRDALEIRWAGSVSNTEIVACMHVGLLDSYALGAFTLAPKERFDERHRTMTDVFRTFGYDKPAGDPRLVGSWRYTKTHVSGSFGSVTERYLTLAADGTCCESGKFMAGMEHTDSTGQVTGSTSADSGDSVYRGRWRVEGKEIVIAWVGANAERWGFYVEGNSMLWKDGKARKLWERTR